MASPSAQRPTDDAAGERILAACYDDMRRIARGIVAGDQMRAVFQPTDLVNEAAIRLIQAEEMSVTDRGHMLALAARTMRRVLIDEARKVAAAKRRRPELYTGFPGAPVGGELVDVEELDGALAALERFSPDHAKVVELRFTLGMTVEETAASAGLAERTVKRRWAAARAWLHDYLTPGGVTHAP